MKNETPFVDLLFKELEKRRKQHHELQFYTIQGMTGAYRLSMAKRFSLDGVIAEQARSEFSDAVFEINGLQNPKKWRDRVNHLIDVTVPPFEHTWIDAEWINRAEHEINDNGMLGFLIHRTPKTFLVEVAVEATTETDGRRAGPMPFSFLIATDPLFDVKGTLGDGWRPFMVAHLELPRVYYKIAGGPNHPGNKNWQSLGNIFLPTLLGVLVLMNVVPTVKTDVKPKGSHLVNSRIKPFFSKTKITLELPHRMVQKSFNSVASGRGPVRRHQVRGHFRHYVGERGELLRRVWIKDHCRGDASVGWVRQDHEVIHGDRPATINPTVYMTPRNRS